MRVEDVTLVEETRPLGVLSGDLGITTVSVREVQVTCKYRVFTFLIAFVYLVMECIILSKILFSVSPGSYRFLNCWSIPCMLEIGVVVGGYGIRVYGEVL